MTFLKKPNEFCKMKATQSKHKNHVCVCVFINNKLFEKEISTERNQILKNKWN